MLTSLNHPYMLSSYRVILFIRHWGGSYCEHILGLLRSKRACMCKLLLGKKLTVMVMLMSQAGGLKRTNSRFGDFGKILRMSHESSYSCFEFGIP